MLIPEMVTMSTGVLVLPYIIPMLLGRTFDMFTSQVGVDIFSKEAVEDPIVIERRFVSSDFRVIRNDSEARQFLGVSDDLSLRIKAGVLTIAAMGDYLKDIQTRDNYVEILVKSKYETMAHTLHGSVNPITDWDLQSPTYLGSHFVRSITYGGMLLASLRLYVRNHEEKHKIESFLGRHFGLTTIEVGVTKKPEVLQVRQEYHSFEEKLKRLVYATEEYTGNDIGLRIKYYSTVSAPFVPQDINSFLRLLEQFPSEAARLNGGRGVPLLVELVPLNELSARMMALRPNKYLESTLKDMDDKFTDLLLTNQAIRDMSDKNDEMSKMCEVKTLDTDIHEKLDVFKDVIRHLDLAVPSSVDRSGRAVQAYDKSASPSQRHYYNKLKQLTAGENTAARSNSLHASDSLNPSLRQGAQLPVQFSPLDHFGYLAEMSMANGVCASLNKFSGSFLTLRRNCTSSRITTCADTCWTLQGPNTTPFSRVQGGECMGVVVAELHVSQNVAVGAKTTNLGRGACSRHACHQEYCCCRLGGRMGLL